jgi:type 1 glutamine amidotransferase
MAMTAMALVAFAPAYCAEPTWDASGSQKPVRLLFLTQSFGYKHSSVTRKEDQLSTAERTMVDLGIASNLFRVDCSQDAVKDLTKENLQNYDIVMFYTTGFRKQWPVDDAALEYLCNDWAKQKGHGFIGIHSAADTLEDYQPYWEMLGASFIFHPWTAGSTVSVKVDDPNHPISRPWGEGFTVKDEIYEFNHWQPEKVHVLMSLDLEKSSLPAAIKEAAKKKMPVNAFVPIAWCKEYGDGKVFHMSLGHNEAVWADERYQQSLLGGIKWILGLEKGDATPNPEIEARETPKGQAAIEAASKASSEESQ